MATALAPARRATAAVPFTVAAPPPPRVRPTAPSATGDFRALPLKEGRAPALSATGDFAPPPREIPAQPKPAKPHFVKRGVGPLYEIYRPRKWREICGQQAALRKLEILRKTPCGLSGRAYWLSGISGCGKSTIAYCLAAHVADHWGIDEIDAKSLNATRIAELERESNCRCLGEKGGRSIVVNEAHLLSKDSVGQLLTTLEAARIPRHVVWIFTTTTAAQKTIFEGKLDAFPFVSRCVKLELSADVGLAFARRAREIAQAEGLDGGKDEGWFTRLVLANKCSLRAVLQEIEGGAAL